MSTTSLPTPPAEFQGWIGKDKESIGNLEHGSYTPKPFEETDVDIAISHCGICASDLHTLRSGWFPSLYPQVVGHEIVGIAVRVGKDVKHIKVGDRVGVGAQSGSCRECEECQAERESYCLKGQIGTYNGKFPDGSKSFGGYADFSRVPAHFAIKVPEGLPSAIAAPMMCGGVTVYSPLRQYGAGTERKRVGIIGIGGLGHFGLLFAKAMGAEVTAISHTASKKKDAEAMGATHFIATADGDHVFDDNAGKLDLIICTTNNHDMPLVGYLKLLSRHGYFVFVGAPEEPLPQLQVFPLIMTNVHITGSAIGSPAVIQEMLELAAKQNVKAWIEERPLEKVNEALIDMENSKARYRYVLVNSAHKHLVKE